jgi:hypothetical protein
LYNDGDLDNQIAELEGDSSSLKENQTITEENKTVTIESDELLVDFWSMDFDGSMSKEGVWLHNHK